MFKKLIPVVCLLAFATGPVFAADTTTPSDTPAKTSTHKKHSHKSKKSKSTSTDSSSAPK